MADGDLTGEKTRAQTDEAAASYSATRRDFLLVVVLFVAFRLLGVLFLRPGGLVYSGGHDFIHYLQLAEYSLQGKWPYLDFWLEYPPLFPFVLVGLYQITSPLPTWSEPLLWFQLAVSGFLVVWETGNLLLVSALARRLNGESAGLRAAWLYALLFYPFYTLTNWFDAWPLFFLLLALYLGGRGHPALSGLAVGLGIMTKLIPVVALPALFLRFTQRRERLRLVGSAAAVVLGVSIPLFIANPTMFLASLQSMLGRPSWLTPWALLEGYYGVGQIPGPYSRLDPAAAAWQSHPTILPPVLVNLVLGALLLWLFSRRLDWRSPRALVVGTAIALNLLILFSKGWSPQFTLYLLAFVVLVMPGAAGVAYALALTFVAFLEWPIAGQLFAGLPWLLAVAITLRSALLVALSLEYVALLWPARRARWEAVRNPVAAVILAALAVFALFAAPPLATEYASRSDLNPVARYVTALAQPEPLLVPSSRRAYYGLKPLLPEARGFPPPDDVWRDATRLSDYFRSLTIGTSEAWLILDHSQGDPAQGAAALSWFDRWGARATDARVGPFHVVGYSAYDAPITAGVAASANFADELRLEGWEPPSADLVAQQPLRVTLHWRALSQPEADYVVLVRLLDSQGQTRARSERLLRGPRGLTGSWRADDQVRDVHDLRLPEQLAPGGYSLSVGVYEAQVEQRWALQPAMPGESFVLPGWPQVASQLPPP
ncbi:MAG: glycosyltransferase 87 family protein [Chloroflexota bacterium]